MQAIEREIEADRVELHPVSIQHTGLDHPFMNIETDQSHTMLPCAGLFPLGAFEP